MLVLRIMLMSFCSRSIINMSKSDLSVTSVSKLVSDEISVLRIMFISVCSGSHINVLDQVLVLTIVLMLLYIRYQQE